MSLIILVEVLSHLDSLATPLTPLPLPMTPPIFDEEHSEYQGFRTMPLMNPQLSALLLTDRLPWIALPTRAPQQRCPNPDAGESSVLVAIIDTGMDVQHLALRHHLWQNPGESGLDGSGKDRASNGVDDDGNGYVDDVHGWNFVGNNSNLADRHGHGTHIAGIVAASPANGRPSSSPCPSPVRLMILKYFDPYDSMGFNLRNTVQAIRYATRMGAQIINYSAGGFSPNRLEEAAIRDAGKRGILFVAAAGNDNQNVDVRGFFPASYSLPNIVSVTAIDTRNRFLDGSNFGESHIDLAAPGQDIWSSLPGNKFGLMSGTSQATAMVSRLAAHTYLIYKEKPDPARMRAELLRRGVKDRRLAGKTRYQVRLRETNVDTEIKAKDDSLAFSVSEPTGGKPNLNQPSL